jgi:hypothetical protein
VRAADSREVAAGTNDDRVGGKELNCSIDDVLERKHSVVPPTREEERQLAEQITCGVVEASSEMGDGRVFQLGFGELSQVVVDLDELPFDVVGQKDGARRSGC